MLSLERRRIGWNASTHEIVVTDAVLGAATTIIVALRFYARYRRKSKYGLDDWFALLALMLFWSHVICAFYSASRGILNIDVKHMPISKIADSLRFTFVNIYLMACTITAARLSIVFLYHRIFGIYATFRKALWVNGALSVAWVVMIIFLNTFRCKPVSAAWNPFLQKTACLDLEVLFLYTESINCALDLALVLIPIFKIPTLHLSLRDKIALSFVFLTGGFVCITSIMRIIFTYDYLPANPVLSIFWLTLQLAFAIICACLPTLRTFLPNSLPQVPSLMKLWSDRSRSKLNGTSKGTYREYKGNDERHASRR